MRTWGRPNKSSIERRQADERRRNAAQSFAAALLLILLCAVAVAVSVATGAGCIFQSDIPTCRSLIRGH